MRKIFTLFVVSFFTLIASAQGQHAAAAMKFVGKANFSVSSVNVPVESDTILYAGSDFTIPSMTYSMAGHDMVIPSFVITNTTFTGGYAGVTWEDQTFTATTTDGNTVNGSSLMGSFTHNNGIYNVKLSITFTYGKMPMPITYTIDSYYVKAYSTLLDATIDQTYQTAEAVTYNVRTYLDGDVTKVDIEVPTFSLTESAIGALTSGGYTVKGLVYDEVKKAYYRDYTSDGLKMHFTATGMDSDYELGTNGKKQEISVAFDGTKDINIQNVFQPGRMPFPIATSFVINTSTDVKTIATKTAANIEAVYNLSGQRGTNGAKGLLIKNGKKYICK